MTINFIQEEYYIPKGMAFGKFWESYTKDLSFGALRLITHLFNLKSGLYNQEQLLNNEPIMYLKELIDKEKVTICKGDKEIKISTPRFYSDVIEEAAFYLPEGEFRVWFYIYSVFKKTNATRFVVENKYFPSSTEKEIENAVSFYKGITIPQLEQEQYFLHAEEK